MQIKIYTSVREGKSYHFQIYFLAASERNMDLEKRDSFIQLFYCGYKTQLEARSLFSLFSLIGPREALGSRGSNIPFLFSPIFLVSFFFRILLGNPNATAVQLISFPLVPRRLFLRSDS